MFHSAKTKPLIYYNIAIFIFFNSFRKKYGLFAATEAQDDTAKRHGSTFGSVIRKRRGKACAIKTSRSG